MVFGPGSISTSLHNIIRIDNNGNFRIKRILRRSIPILIFFDVFLLLCGTAQSVIISKCNTVPEFAGIQYLSPKTSFTALVLKNFRLLKFPTAPL